MISDLKPYPKMKDTGLPWAGQVPSHWELVPNRALLRKRKVLVGDRHTEYRLLSLTKAGVIVRDISTGRGKFSSDMGTSQELREGDLVFCLFDVPETPRTVGLSKHHGMITGAYTVFECKDNQLAHFLEAFYIAMDDRKLLSPLYSGLRNTIPQSVLLEQKTPLPPASEQAAIIRFLDHAERKIRRYIRAKQKLIKLLEEQKQAIIHRAVTRGLDPSVPLKPSGIPWLGDIPQHWMLKRFKFLATINTGQVDPRKAEYRDLVLIAPNHVQSGSGRLMKQETADEQGADSGKYLVRRGQVIYSKIRPNLRKATIAPCDCLCSADMYPMEPRTREISTDYFLLLLLSQPFTKFAVDTSMRVAMPKVNREALADCLMWYPDSDEQCSILKFIARESAPIHTAISPLEREIELLREYRTRLVVDVVTGKLDVREAAAQLPDKDQELPSIEEFDEIRDPEEDDLDDLAQGTEEPEP